MLQDREMIQIELYGKPVSWTPSRSCGSHYYNPRAEDKEVARWQIRAQYRDEPILGPVHLDFVFFIPIPKNTSYVRRRQMLAHILLPEVTPDTTNMQKFYEDCLKGIVIGDDRSATDISSKKRYSEKPGVLIRVIALNQNKPQSTEENKDATCQRKESENEKRILRKHRKGNARGKAPETSGCYRLQFSAQGKEEKEEVTPCHV